MPDMQTEMGKVLGALTFDDATEEIVQPKKTAKERIFDYIKANQMTTYLNIDVGSGIKDTGKTSSLLRAMTDSGHLRRERVSGLYCYSTAKESFTPFDRAAALAKAHAARCKKTNTTKVPDATALSKPRAHNELLDDAKAFVASLPLAKARAIYNELKGFFE